MNIWSIYKRVVRNEAELLETHYRLAELEDFFGIASPPPPAATAESAATQAPILCPESSCLNLAACRTAERCIERAEAVS